MAFLDIVLSAVNLFQGEVMVHLKDVGLVMLVFRIEKEKRGERR